MIVGYKAISPIILLGMSFILPKFWVANRKMVESVWESRRYRGVFGIFQALGHIFVTTDSSRATQTVTGMDSLNISMTAPDDEDIGVRMSGQDEESSSSSEERVPDGDDPPAGHLESESD